MYTLTNEATKIHSEMLFFWGWGGSGAVWWEGNSVTIVCVAKIHYWNGDTDVRGQ